VAEADRLAAVPAVRAVAEGGAAMVFHVHAFGRAEKKEGVGALT